MTEADEEEILNTIDPISAAHVTESVWEIRRATKLMQYMQTKELDTRISQTTRRAIHEWKDLEN